MTFAAAITSVFFGFLAGVLGVVAKRAKDGGVPFGSRLGLPGAQVRKNAATWERVHRKAAPYFATAAIIAGIQALAAGAALAFPGLGTVGYLITLTVTGLALIFGLLFLAPRT